MFHHYRLNDGRLPLQFACDSKDPQPQLATALIDHGADIHIPIQYVINSSKALDILATASGMCDYSL